MEGIGNNLEFLDANHPGYSRCTTNLKSDTMKAKEVWPMNEEIMQDVGEQLAGALAYDKAAKNVLSQKKVLAYILKRTVPEFESVSLDDIMPAG